MRHTFPLSSAPYGGFSSAPDSAPSLSPPLSSCRICWALFCTSAVETGATAGVREVRSKLAGLSGSRASMLIVRQLMLAMVGVSDYRLLQRRGTVGAGGGGRRGRREWSSSLLSGEVATRRARSWGAAACLHTAKRRGCHSGPAATSCITTAVVQARVGTRNGSLPSQRRLHLPGANIHGATRVTATAPLDWSSRSRRCENVMDML